MKKLMLAANTLPDIDTIQYPVLASGKLDGIRGCVQEKQLISRSLKSSLNRHVTAVLSQWWFEGLDGEITVAGESWNDFNTNQSTIMTQSGTPDFTFHVFDDMSVDGSAVTRKFNVQQRAKALKAEGYNVEYCLQHVINNSTELKALYEEYRAKGYEGLILMDPGAKYKHGRSTLKQEIMLKLKPHEDDEAELIDFIPVQHNQDAGNSNKLENMVEGDRVGRLIAKWKGRTINVGPGKLTHALATDMYYNFDKYKGRLFTFTFMELFEATGEPRSARFKGFRSKGDLCERTETTSKDIKVADPK